MLRAAGNYCRLPPEGALSIISLLPNVEADSISCLQRYPKLFEAFPNGIYNRVTNERIEDITSKKGCNALLIISR